MCGLYCFLGFDSKFIKLHGASSLLYILFPLQNRGLLFFILEKEDKNYLQGVKGKGCIAVDLLAFPVISC
ncbi:MAG: hypothetical protein D3922_01730 [Candidatus Electrothrix sp. AR1]|nr:hypothetical protein [Candidatus Electrothrix sp. AR1]